MIKNSPGRAKKDKESKNTLKKLHNIETIINRSPVIYCIWRFAEDAPVEYISSNIKQWGYTQDDFISGNATWYGITHPDDITRLKSEIIDHLKQKTKTFDQCYRIIDQAGEIHWVEDQNIFVYDNKGKITHIQGTVIDVTDRHKTQQALQETQNIYQTIFENTGTAIAITAKNRTILLVNDKMQELTDFSKEELINNKTTLESLIVPHDLERLKYYNRLRLADATQAPKHYEYQIITKSGEYKDILATSVLIPGTQNSLVSMTDITYRKKVELGLQKSEERLKELFHNSTDITIVIDENGVFKYVSPSVKRILNYDEKDLIGQSGFNFIHPDDTDAALNALKEVVDFSNRGIPTEFRFRHNNGNWINLEALGNNCLADPSINGIILNCRDVTDRKRIEAELLHAQKMEAIGRLAGGIAHDFNNILMGIQGYISLLLLKIDTIHPDFEKLINIQTLVQSGADLTGKLMGFARGGRYELKPTDINTLIAKTVNLFGRTKKEIAVHQKYEKKPWTVEVDRVQIEQVILNILVNAWQAMPQGGDIYVETQNVAISRLSPGKDIEAGNYVKITIADTGMGMDEDTRQRIFEPFFTTKEKVRGVGLGLASAFGIIKEHGGIIDVVSEKEKGTTFTIHLPTSNKEVPKEAYAAKTILTGNEAILLVDDEASIIDVCRDILISLGYKIFTAGSGYEAIDIYKLNKDKIDLVILDMIMPGLNGSEIYNQLKSINPQIKVILSTGYSISDQAQKILDNGCQAIIQKPFRIDDLSQKIREVLNQGQQLPDETKIG